MRPQGEKKNKNMLLEPEQFAKRGLSRRKRLSPKQEKFVQLFVYHDLTKKECAIRAGYKSPSVSASTMLHGVQFRHVQDRIAELTESKQLKYGITFDKVSRDLQMIRDAALEDGAYGPAVQAEMGRAKLAGLMIDKKEIKTGKIDQMDRSEVELRLQALLDKNELMAKVVDEVTDEGDQEVDQESGDVEALGYVDEVEEVDEAGSEDLEDDDWEVVDDDDWDEDDDDLPNDLEDETEGEG